MKKSLNFEKRKKRVRTKIKKSGKPRILVHKSNRFLYVQVIDVNGFVICSVNDKGLENSGKFDKDSKKRAEELGKNIAKKLIDKKIKEVVFDRSGYKYHGKIKAVAEGAREGGLIF